MWWLSKRRTLRRTASGTLTRTFRTSSLNPDASSSDHLCPFVALQPELSGTFLNCSANRLATERFQSLLHVRQRNDPDDLTIEQRDDLFGRSCRGDHRKPCVAFYIGITSFR